MQMQSRGTILLIAVMIGILGTYVFISGCFSNQSENISPSIPSLASTTITTLNESAQGASPDTSIIYALQITVHNITIESVEQPSKEKLRLAVLDISLKNREIDKVFSIDNDSMVCIESDQGTLHFFLPVTEYHPSAHNNPIIPYSLGPGEEKRGTVVFQLRDSVKSMVLYAKYPNWTIAGEVFIPNISNGFSTGPDEIKPKNLTLDVHSAVRYTTLPGFDRVRSGIKIAVINASITNHNPEDVVVQRDHVVILTEQGTTLEHGGDRLTREKARNYTRFPIVIHPDERKDISIIYLVRSTKINTLILTDSNFVIQQMVDLNNIYIYS